MGNTSTSCARDEPDNSYTIPSIRSTGSRISQAPSLPTIEEETSTNSQLAEENPSNDEIMVKRSKSGGGPMYTSDPSDIMMNLIDLRHQKEEKKVDDLAYHYQQVAQQQQQQQQAQQQAQQQQQQQQKRSARPADEVNYQRQQLDPYGMNADDGDDLYKPDAPTLEETKKGYRVAYEEMSGNIEIEQIPEIHEVFSNENTRVITNSAYPVVIDQGRRTVVEGVFAEGIQEESCEDVKQEEPTRALDESTFAVSEINEGPVWERPQLPPQAYQESDYDGFAYDNASAYDEEIDLEFVEQYDSAFNEFVAANPHFLINNPDLVHNLRVTKLQKCLERGDELEEELKRKIADLRLRKSETELYYQRQLKEASRKKAAREIQLKSSLDEFKLETKVMQGKLNWDLLLSSQSRVQKLYDLRQHLKATETPLSWEELLKMLPDDGPDAQAIRDAVLAPSLSRGTTTKEQENDLRQFQVDNAFLNAEVSVLLKKLAYQKLAAKKHAWVETVLLRLDPKAIRKLKSRYQKKLGVPLAS